MFPSEYLIQKYQQNVPRYTSYPPANYFHEQTVDAYKHAIIESNATSPNTISIYIHIPFCAQLCWYCGCNTSGFSDRGIITEYLKNIYTEILNTIELLDTNRKISQIHFGGGTPSILTKKELQKIVSVFYSHFSFTKNAEIAIECNPANLSFSYIDDLVSLGFNRISLGIQDFDTNILSEVHREIPKIPIPEIASYIQSKKVKLNFDFIYGLPYQTKESFTKTISKAISCNPDRIVTFSYAHMPSLKPLQKKLDGKPMVTGKEKLEILYNTHNQILESGYISIGFDHFAKPHDELALALQKKKLHRNFQGYCTRESTGQIYAFGASGISQFSNSFFQNSKSYITYNKEIQEKGFATAIGHKRSLEEQWINTVIEMILCNNIINWQEIAKLCNTEEQQLRNFFSFSHETIHELLRDNLLETQPYGYSVTKTGSFFSRNIAAAFDPTLSKSDKLFSSSI